MQKVRLMKSSSPVKDAARSDLDFACQVFGVAIAGGATIINVPDTVGYMNPNEFGDKIRYIKEHTPGIEKCNYLRSLS